MANQQYRRTGSFVPTTQVWDQSQIEKSNISPEVKNLLVRLYQNINQIALVLNTKSTGAFYQQEFVIGDLLYPNTTQKNTYRQIMRKVVAIDSLPGGATPNPLLVPHGLNPSEQWSFTRIYGAATDVSGAPNFVYIPMPYAAVVAANTLELYVDQTNVIITSGGTNYSNYSGYVILEYVTT